MIERVLTMRSGPLEPGRYRLAYWLADGTEDGVTGEIIQPDGDAAFAMFRTVLATHRPRAACPKEAL